MRLPLASIAGCTANRELLLLVTVLVSVWLFSSAPPPLPIVAKLEIVLSPESSKTVSLAEDRDMVGASFTAVTVIDLVTRPELNGERAPLVADLVSAVVPAVPALRSQARYFMLAVPLKLASGTKRTL